MAAFKGGGQFYRYRAPVRAASQSNDVERGLAAGQMVGKLLGQVGDIAKGIKSNQVANDLMTKQAISAQPGAGVTQDLGTLPADDGTAPNDFTLPSVASPIAGDDSGTVGGLIQTGGTAELKARQDAQKNQLDTAIKQAQLANSLAKLHGTDSYAKRATAAPQGVTVQGGSSSRWLEGGDGGQQGGSQQQGGQRGSKPAPYQAGSVDAENDDSADDMSKVAADFDAAQGGQKGTYAKFLANLPTLAPDANGNYTLKDKDGNPQSTVLASDVPYWVQRTNAARRAHNLAPMEIPPGKTAGNPIVLTNPLHARSLPYGTYVKDPKTGQTYTIDRPPTQ
jgi:hypothetical protein